MLSLKAICSWLQFLLSTPPPQAPQCGLLASPDLTLGLLEAVERGQTSTEEVNTFLDRALSRAIEDYPTVQVTPGSLHWGLEFAVFAVCAVCAVLVVRAVLIVLKLLVVLVVLVYL